MEKPGDAYVEEMAKSFWISKGIAVTRITETDMYRAGFDRCWNTYVVSLESEIKALREENLRLQNRVSSLENIAEMDRKTEYQYNQLYKEKEALRDWKEYSLAVFAEWDRVSDYIEPRCRLGDKYSARALELFKMIDAENKSLHEEIFTLKNEIDRLKAEVLKEKFPEN